MRNRLAVAAALLLLLAGCSLEPPQEPLETAIPAALMASDLGVLDAEASVGIDGFARELSVYVTFDRSTVSTDDVVRIVELSIEHSDRDDFARLNIGGIDGTADGFALIDLGAVGADLGFSRDPVLPSTFVLRWEQALALVGDES